MKNFEFLTENPFYRKYRFEVSSAAVLAVILALILYVIQPIAGNCINTFTGLLERGKAISDAQNFEKNLKKAIDQNNELKSRSASLKMNVSNGRTLSNIYAMVNKASGFSGVTVVSTNTLPEAEGSNFVRLRFDIEVKGPYNAIGRFLDGMEQSGYIVSADELVLENTYGQDLSGRLKISLYLYK
jgi:hypothetical protein